MKSQLLLFLCFISACGCENFSNKVDRLAIECSVPTGLSGRYMKIQSSTGLSFKGEAASRLQANFVNGQGIKTPLTVTGGGCVEIPDQVGLLSVVDPIAKESMTRSIVGLQEKITEGILQELTEFSLNLNCPIDGFYADETLSSPESLALNGDSSGLEYYLDLYNSQNQFLRRLSHKSLGEGLRKDASQISVGDLPEGTYSLKLFGRHIANGIDTKPALVNPEKNCALYVIHGAVNVKGIDTLPQVVAKGASLNWKPEKLGQKLFVCRESRNQCQATLCRKESDFQQVNEILAEQAGVFDYYVYAGDQLGRQSAKSCQTVIVSDTRPSLSVEWEAEDLRAPGSILRVPYATIKASASLSHDLVDRDVLEKNLQCKVSFEIKGTDELTGNKVSCTKGRCLGKPMGQFVPCDSEIGFSLVEAWEQPLIANSLIRLQVKSHDGAGHEVEAEASFWINESVWSRESLLLKDGEATWSLQDWQLSKSGVVIAIFSDGNSGKRIARLVDDEWEIISRPSQTYFIQFFKDSDEVLTAVISYRDENDQSFDEYWEFSDDGNIRKRVNIQKDNYLYSCENYQVDEGKRLWCFTNRQAFTYFENDSWHVLPVRGTDNGQSDYLYAWLVDKEGRLWAIADDYLLMFQEGRGWIKINVEPERKFSRWNRVLEDKKGRIWLVSISQEDYLVDGLYLLEHGKIKKFPSPEPIQGRNIQTAEDLQRTRVEKFQVDFQIFDFATEIWTKVDEGIKLSEEMGDLESTRLDEKVTVLSLQNHGLFEQRNELIYWPMKNFGFNGFYSTLLGKSGDSFYFQSKELNGYRQVVRIKTHRGSRFDGSMINFQGSYAIDSWIDSEGHGNFAMPNGTILKMSGDKVEKLPFRLKPNPTRAFPLHGGRYCFWSGYSLYVTDQHSESKLAYEGNGNTAMYECREDFRGRFWITTDSFGYVDSSRKFHPMFPVMSEETGRLNIVEILNGGRTLWVPYDKLVRIVSTETDEVKEVWYDQLFPDIKIDEFRWPSRISETEFAIHIVDTDGKHHSYIYDINTGVITADETLAAFGLNYTIGNSNYRGDTAWSYAVGSDKIWVLLTRKNKVWTRAREPDFAPWPDLPRPAIKWVPDLSGHVWFMSSFPNYEFYRYDP